MSKFIQFVLLGLSIGSIYGLSGIGIVVVYRASGVLNFASGSVGAVAAFLYYDLLRWGWPEPVALIASVIIGGVIGAATQFLLMRRMRNSSAVVKLIATLGLFTLLQGICLVVWGPNTRFVNGLFPPNPLHIGAGIVIDEDSVALFVLTMIVAGALWVLYKKTLFGLATTAVAQNRRAAAGLGWATDTIELLNWTVGGALYAFTAILLTPQIGLSVAGEALLILPALAAALIGRFSSFPLAILGGMILGIAESLLDRYTTITGASSAVPFLLVTAIIVAGGRARPARSDLTTRLPMPGSGIINYRALAAFVVVMLIFVWFANPEWIDAGIITLLIGMLVLSVIVVSGLAGQLSLAQWVLAGLGSLVAGQLVVHAHFPFWAAAIVGGIGAALAGLVVALPSLRTRGVNLAVATLGLAVAIQAAVLSNSTLSGGFNGLTVGAPTLFGISLDPIATPSRYATLVLIVFVLLGVGIANLRRSTTGRRMLAVRSNERVAASFGIRVYHVKLYAFAIAAFIAGLAGVLYGYLDPILTFTQYDVPGSINAVVYAVVGGLGNVPAAFVGGLMPPGSIVATLINSFGDLKNWLPVISGALLLLTVVQAPDGVVQLNIELGRKVMARLRGGTRAPAQKRQDSWGTDTASRSGKVELAARAVDAPTVTLAVSGLSVRYGSVIALDGVDFTARAGEVTGLIGPNGAGKTTILDAVSGLAKPASGTIRFNNEVVNGLSVEKRALSGLSRSFQAVELLPEMTVRENLLLAAESGISGRYLADLVHPGVARATDLLKTVVTDLNLSDVLDRYPGQLPHGTQRLVGIARALVADPRVLLLDEPAAGLDRGGEREELSRLIVAIARQLKVAVVLVEHDVELVMSSCDRVVVLNFGQVIADGAPTTVRNDPAVIEAYLGAPVDASSVGSPTASG